MNKKELSQLYYLNREIEQLKSRIEELECIAVSDTSRITGMPHVTGISDKVGRYVAEIADLKELLNLNLKKCFYELNRLNRYIESIDDSQMRMIMTLRYVNELSWRQIAFSIGGGNTEDSIKKLAYRYLKKN
ncbi:RNA polymerase subunit sigma-24 [Clostridium tyrobutyricum]|uniref:RNA polymerase subunit sigma-24 n=1 Tax=Clostridium tyrobutyricum TaxID=1519 RepID=UPI00189CA0E1|nr:RNA polymerase subunit sigma-24 [Clostridium tyrobutyricum]